MSLRFGSGWLVMYSFICCCTFITKDSFPKRTTPLLNWKGVNATIYGGITPGYAETISLWERMNVVPFPGSDCKSISMWFEWRMDFVFDNPSPKPPGLVVK